MPGTSSADAAIVAAQDLVHALQNPTPAAPIATVQPEQADALATLSRIFLDRANTLRPVNTVPRVAPASVTPPSPRVPTAILPASPRVKIVRIQAPLQTPFNPAHPRAPERPGPALVEPETDDPVHHRYHLHLSQINISASDFTSPILDKNAQANSVIYPATGNFHKYPHLLRGSDKSIWIQGLANDL